MRAFALLAALAALALVPPTTGAAFAARPFAAAPNASFILSVDDPGNVDVAISLRGGAYDRIVVAGPGSCRLDGEAGARVFLSCGFLQEGSYRLSLRFPDGAAAGQVSVTGASFGVR